MAPPLQHPLSPLPLWGRGERGLGGEEVRIVVKDEAGDERRFSRRGTSME
jgi:hypothetical protein